MNINNLNKGNKLQIDVDNVFFGLQECIDAGMFIDATITSSTIRNSGDSYIGVKVVLREDGEIVTKYIAFSVVNGVIYSAIPLTALCDM